MFYDIAFTWYIPVEFTQLIRSPSLPTPIKQTNVVSEIENK